MIGTKRDPAKNENTGLNSILKNLLCNVDVGDAIPTEVYDAVAHIIAYITELDSSL